MIDGRLTTTYSKGGAAMKGKMMPMHGDSMMEEMAETRAGKPDNAMEEKSEKARGQKNYFRKKSKGHANPDSMPGSKPFVG